MTRAVTSAAAAVLAAIALAAAPTGQQPATAPPAPASLSPERAAALAARHDPYAARPRIVVMTDIANEPDDQMSMVRLLVYANELDLEGLIATTSTWMRNRVRPDVIRAVIDAYAKARPNLLKQAPGYPTAEQLTALVTTGQPGFGMAAVGPDKLTPGAEQIITAADRRDPRPLWVLGWGGANTLAQALLHVRATRPPAAVDALVDKLRVYTISDQDDAGAWLRREFPALHYIAHPSTQDGDEYYLATWTGISGDRFYRNAPGADFTTFTDAWVKTHIRSQGPLGALYIPPCCIHEGDTPSFLGLIDNGLASAISPSYGGWGGRYVWRQPSGEPRPFWTQGGDSYPGRDSSRDTVAGIDNQSHTTDQATIWRWRTAFQHDFAARMAWAAGTGANHNPRAVVNGDATKAPIAITTPVGTPVTLDASASTDPDGHTLTYRWFFYAEAATGIPNLPVRLRPQVGGGGTPGEGGIPSAAEGGPPQPRPRLTLTNADTAKATATLDVPGIAHVILEVTDGGTPVLTSYRRVILRSPAQPAAR
jgi:hypothetical protein